MDVSVTADWWCWGNPYGGSPYHLANHTCLAGPLRAGVAEKLGPLSLPSDVSTIANDVVDEYCCSGARGEKFQTAAGHTEHLLARKVCGREGKQACGDHDRGWHNLRQARLIQTVVRSPAGADCGAAAARVIPSTTPLAHALVRSSAPRTIHEAPAASPRLVCTEFVL